MSVSKFLAFDFGAESGRAIAGILEGGRISLEEVHRFPNKQINISGHIHWDIHYLFDEIKKGLYLAAKAGHSNIESIGVDTWGVDFGFVNKDKEIKDYPFAYRDSRTNGIMEKVFEKMPAREIYKRTGTQVMQINSLYQLYSAKLSGDKNLSEDNKLLFMPDLFNFFLTGEMKSEYTIASTSQLLNVHTKTFDDEIFRALNLPEEITAPLIMPGNIVGNLKSEIAGDSGIKNVDVIAVGCHDTQSAIAAIPATGDNWAYISSGTWSLAGTELQEPITTDEALQNGFTNEIGVPDTITFHSNVMGLWLIQELRKVFEKKGNKVDYDKLMNIADEAEEFKSIINPDDAAFLNPDEMSTAIREFCRKTSQPCPENKGEYTRCVLESLALRYKKVIIQIGRMTGKKIERIHIVGGGSQNNLLNQFTADACGIPVAAGPVEATALGNILVQAVAKGKIKSIKNGKEIIARSFPVKMFLPKDTAKWDKAYQRFNFG